MAVSRIGRDRDVLLDRDRERDAIDLLLADARRGRAAALVVRGEAGIGKTSLLEYAAGRAERWRVIRASGIESEMELPFAGLHQLCTPLLEGLDRLPEPQQNALGTAFGLSLHAPADRFLIGLAALSLLADAAEELPLLCLVDDAQWMDRASMQVMAFVARRLLAEPVGLIFAVRESSEELGGLPELVVEGLADGDARESLGSVLVGALDEAIRERIVAETRGKPLALLELPRGLSPAEVAGGFALPGAASLSVRIEKSFLRRLEPLPEETRMMLLLAAAEPSGNPALLSRAAESLELATTALEPAEQLGLLDIDARVRFSHPLVRSAVYRAAPLSDRRTVHAALAEVTDEVLDADRRAWHRAEATWRPEEDVANELERSAEGARRRGGVAAAAAFLERASTLTPDPSRRAQRALAAAQAKQLAGAPEAALSLLATAESGPLDDFGEATAIRLHGQIALDLRQAGDALPLLVDAARRLEALDPNLARYTHLEAMRAASVAGRLGTGLVDAADAARNAPPPQGPPRALDVLLDGLTVRFTDGYAASAPALKQALKAVRDEGGHPGTDARWPWQARRVAVELFDDDTWNFFATRSVQIARETGALAVLPLALNYLAYLRCAEGKLRVAAALLEEADAIAAAIGTKPILWGRLYLAAWRGDQAEASAVFDASERAAVAQREGVVLTISEHMRAVLHNGLGQYETALDLAETASTRDELGNSAWSLPELAESAIRCGRAELAGTALERLGERTRSAGTDLALGIEARVRALLGEGNATERLYLEAIERLDRTRIRTDLARAHLLYGEWLRRERRRLDAREQLRTAHELFSDFGAQAFAARARVELEATGEHARKRTVDTLDQLTPQEAQIARLVADGLANREIAAQLFIVEDPAFDRLLPCHHRGWLE